MSGVNWSYFDKFSEIDNKYLPIKGEGENMATQIVTAVAKLVYKWYNDGDTPDNTHYLSGWWNDLSSYANWLYEYVPETREILDNFFNCTSGDSYEENVLKPLCDLTQTFEFLANYENRTLTGSIYEDCDGPFVWEEETEEDEDEWYEDEYEDDEYEDDE